jgi:hypothetical protein
VIALLVVVVLVVFAVVMIHAASWAGVHFLVTGGGLLILLFGLGFLALYLYHRRTREYLLNLETDILGQYRRVNRAMAWPRSCKYCGASFHNRRAIGLHSDPETSACAAHLDRRDQAAELAAREAEPPAPWTATVVKGGDASGIDTFTDEPTAEIES